MGIITGIIMASGFSRRFGSNKLLVSINEKTLIEHTIETVLKSKIDRIIVVYSKKMVLEKIKKYNIKMIHNSKSTLGQSESVKLGMLSSEKNSEGYMFIVGDQYFLNSNTINRLIEKFKENRGNIIISSSDEKSGNPVLFSSEFKFELLELSGDEGGRKVIKNNLDKVKNVKVTKKELWDIDTTEDLEKVIKEVKK